jgi:hypothetical protein
VGADNPAAAEAAAIALRGERIRYEAVGQKRLAIAAIVGFNLAVLAGLVVASLVARRRPRRRPLAVAAAPSPAPVRVLEVADLPARPQDARLPPAPPAWFTARGTPGAAPPPAPTLEGAQPLLPPMTTPPPSVPASPAPGPISPPDAAAGDLEPPPPPSGP